MHKRLQGFNVDDFEMLLTFVNAPSKITLSPNVLSETSNLVRHVKDPVRTEISRRLADLILHAREIYIPSRNAVLRPEYISLGLTDAALLECLSQEGGKLYTTDLKLYLAATSSSLPAENFNHLREKRLDSR